MGEAAAAAATAGPVAEGSVGAGTGATVGKLFGMRQAMKSGIGTCTVDAGAACPGVQVSALWPSTPSATCATSNPAASSPAPARRPIQWNSQALCAASAISGPPPRGPRTRPAVVATNARLNKVQASLAFWPSTDSCAPSTRA